MNQNKFKNWLNLNFEDVLETSDDFRVNCPFCDNDTNHHMYISKTKLIAHCFRCNWGGHRNKFILEFLGYDSLKEYLTSGLEESYVPIASRLHEFLGDFVMSDKQIVQNYSHAISMEMPDWFVQFKNNDNPSIYSSAIYRYSLDRIGYDNMMKYDIGYCKDLNEKYAHRMIIPIEKGYFQARAISEDQKIKYRNPTIPIEDRLFNGMALELHDEVCICEGAISAMTIGNAAIATLTKSAHLEQVERLIRSNVRTFVICYDSGTEYDVGTLKLADTLYKNGKIIIIRSYREGDPASCNIFTEQLYDMKYALLGKFHMSTFHKSESLFR